MFHLDRIPPSFKHLGKLTKQIKRPLQGNGMAAISKKDVELGIFSKIRMGVKAILGI